MILGFRAAVLATALTTAPAMACKSYSLELAAADLAALIDIACSCDRGSILNHSPGPFATAFLRGEAAKYKDNPKIQEAVALVTLLEKEQCIQWETVK